MGKYSCMHCVTNTTDSCICDECNEKIHRAIREGTYPDGPKEDGKILIVVGQAIVCIIVLAFLFYFFWEISAWSVQHLVYSLKSGKF